MNAEKQQLVYFIASRGDWLTGGAPAEEVADEWLETGLSALTIEAYIKAKTFCPRAALRMKEQGVTPFDAAQLVQIAGILETRGYWESNGEY